jgi:ABC-type nitrate/sulfonate/bicarbonate transport system substrate-binding protein
MMNIKSRERLLTIFIILAVICLLVVVGYPIYTGSLPSEVRFGVDKSFNSLPFYVAEMDTTRNYFDLEKIDAALVEITGDPLEGIMNGEYDVAVVPWYWLIISPSLNGDTLKAFGSLELRSGRSLDALIVPPDSRIRRLRDLSGKRLGYVAREEYMVNLIMTKMIEEMNLRNVYYVPLQLDEVVGAFDEDKVDALYLLDPYRAYHLYLGNTALVEGLASTYIIPNVAYGAVVMRKDFVYTENKLAGIRVKNAVEAALSYLARNPDVAKRYVLKINDLPEEGDLIMNMRTPEYERLAEIGLKGIENFQTDLVRRGIGTCGIKPSEFLFEKTAFAR